MKPENGRMVSAAAVSCVAAVCINDNLSACKTAVAHGSAYNETTSGVYEILCIFVK